MTDEQFQILLSVLGFGFGSLFWFAYYLLIFAWRSSK